MAQQPQHRSARTSGASSNYNFSDAAYTGNLYQRNKLKLLTFKHPQWSMLQFERVHQRDLEVVLPLPNGLGILGDGGSVPGAFVRIGMAVSNDDWKDEWE